MADHFYGLNKGDGAGAVQTGTSTTNTHLEIRTRDGVGLTKADAHHLIDVLRNYFVTTNALS